jgi:hypothetical protein
MMMNDCRHVWKVGIYDPNGTMRCQECSKTEEAFIVITQLQAELGRIRPAAQAVVDGVSHIENTDGIYRTVSWTSIDNLAAALGDKHE